MPLTSVLLLAWLAAASGGTDVRPAKLTSGQAPLPAVQGIGWEQARLRVSVAPTGMVDSVHALEGTEPLASALGDAVRRWRFDPAEEAGKPVAAEVLVVGVYRPPRLFDASPFPEERIRAATGRFPVPVQRAAPAYPPHAIGDGAVVVEVLVDEKGHPRTAGVAWSSSAGFDEAAVTAARGWRFVPAVTAEGAVSAYAYLVFGFRQPVVVPKR